MKTKFSGFLTLLLVLIVQITFAQEREVSGTVKDGDGLPLPGVNITVQDSDTGTQTDFDGNYSIKVEQGATLQFSFVGFADISKKVGMQNTIDVVMQQGQEMTAVLVETGYQTQTKRQSTKAVTTITAEDIEDRPNASAIDALQGQVAGLNIGSNSGQPGSSGTVILRGVGSVNGDIEPLFIVDNIPVTKSVFTNLDGNDIESVSVLKGPNATSIYGNRGSNGVIVVTTKGGTYDSKMEITYRSQYSIAKLMPLNMELMTSKQKLTFMRDNNLGVGDLGIAGLHNGMTDAEIDNYASHVNTYWADYFFRTASTNRQQVNITSGSKNLSSATSINYMDQDGIFIASGLQRFGFRQKLNGRSDNDKFHYSTNLNASYSKMNWDNGSGDRNVLNNPFMNAMRGNPLLSPFDPDGSVTTDGGLTYGDSGALNFLNSPYITLNEAALRTQLQEQFNVIGNFHADWEFVDHLTAGVDVGMNLTEFKTKSILPPEALRGPFQVQDGKAEFGGFASEGYQRDARFTTRAHLGYNNTFGKHTIGLNLYTEYNKAHLDGLGFTTRGLNPKTIGTSNGYVFNQDIKENPTPDNPNAEPFRVYSPGTSLSTTKTSVGLFSYFGTLDYDYDERLGLSASIRRDASVRFAHQNKWGTFWSVSGRWNIDGEDFMEESAFNMLKLRAGYGTSGNQRITGGYYGGLDLYRNLYASTSGYNNTSAYGPSVIANPDLRWETTKQINVGVDFGIWKNKLSGTLDVYRKKTEDLYESQPVSLVNATSAINANIGAMENKGVELFLQYNIISNQDWKVSIKANGSYNHNKILKLAGTDADGLVRGGGGNIASKVGESYGEYFVTRYAGVNPVNGHQLYYDIDGNLTEQLREADRVFNNKFVYPEIQGGFGATVSYKGFTLDQNWVYFAHVYRANLDVADTEGDLAQTFYNGSTSLLNSWTTPGQITNMPALNSPISTIDDINGSDRYIEDASYLRLRNISLGYTFDKEQLQRLPFNSVKLYIQAENLLTFTKYKGFDPESGYTGVEASRYPNAKTYSVGLNVNF